jgi:hypothetical protein
MCTWESSIIRYLSHGSSVSITTSMSRSRGPHYEWGGLCLVEVSLTFLKRGTDTHAPDTHTPDTHTPDTHAPDTHTPDTHAPDTHTPDTHAPDTHAPDTHTPDTHAPDTDDYWEAYVASIGHLGHKNLPHIRVPHPVSPFPGWSKKVSW